MRILTIANHLGARGGLERTQLTMCRALAARGHDVALSYVQAGDFFDDWLAFADAMVAVRGTLPKSRSPLTTSFGILDDLRELRALRPQVIYVYRYLDVPLAVALGRMTRAPVVLHLCLPTPDHLPAVVRLSLPRVTMTLAVSHDTAAMWQATSLPADGVMVVHTGIDMDYYVPAPAVEREATRRHLGIEPDAFMALFAGRISPEKGVEVLLEAWDELYEKFPDGRLVVVGGPSVKDDPDEAERYALGLRRAAARDDVQWLEVRRDVLALIQTADVAVAPSIWREPFSRSVIEPLACGVPVIASRIGGNPEILDGWLEQYLVDPGDPKALAEQMTEIVGWRESDPTLADRCRRAVVDRLPLDREVDTVEAALASVALRSPPVADR